MTLQPFNYVPADSLQAAEALLREHGEEGRGDRGRHRSARRTQGCHPRHPSGASDRPQAAGGSALCERRRPGGAHRQPHHARRHRAAPRHPADLSAPRRGSAQRGLATDSQRRDHCGQPLPGAPLLVLPQPRQYLRLPAQGRQDVRRIVRGESLPLHLRRHVRQRRAVRQRLPDPQRHPRVHGQDPGRRGPRSGGDPAANQPAARGDRAGLPAHLRVGLQPVRLRRAGVDP